MQKIRVGVIMGGPSFEYEISLLSGKSVCRNLNANRYEIIPIIIDRSGNWSHTPESLLDLIDVAFISLHGEYGENGEIQDLLDRWGIKYTGSNTSSSALGMNKSATSKILRGNGLLTPESIDVSRSDDWSNLCYHLNYPVVVKPNDRGSSIGVSLVRDCAGFSSALCEVFRYSRHARIERYISGREITCSVLETGNGLIAFYPTELIPKKSLLNDFESKYHGRETLKQVTPAQISKIETEAVMNTALRAHQAINATGFSRTDMILANNGAIYVLEINTIPGLVENHPFLASANVSGMASEMVLDNIIASALRRYQVEH